MYDRYMYKRCHLGATRQESMEGKVTLLLFLSSDSLIQHVSITAFPIWVLSFEIHVEMPIGPQEIYHLLVHARAMDQRGVGRRRNIGVGKEGGAVHERGVEGGFCL